MRLRVLTPRKLLAILIGIATACILGELALRFVLFGESEWARRLGRAWRRPELFVSSADNDDYWKLQARFTLDQALPAPNADTRLGWTGSIIQPGTYAHREEGTIGNRTPILLYGDSNAMCMTEAAYCFQGLLEQSDLGARYALLNYGVGGYGLDQIYLLMRSSLDRFADRHPIVIVSVLVDDDLVRSMLSIRGWPKPRFSLRDGQLVEPVVVETDIRRFLEREPPSIASYAASLVSRTWDPYLIVTARNVRELEPSRALNRALLEAIEAELSARSLEHFFFLFYAEGGLARSGNSAWSEDVILGFLRDTGAPYVSLADFMRTAFDSNEQDIGRLFGNDDPVLNGHLNDGGNRLAFEAMRQGLERRFGKFDFERVRRMAGEGVFASDLARSREVFVVGRACRYVGRSRLGCVRSKPADERSGARLACRAGDDGRTSLVIDLAPGDSRLVANARAVAARGKACASPSMRLSTRIDEGPWTEHTFEIGTAPRAFELSLVSAKQLEMLVEYTGSDPDCAWLSLDDLRFE